MLVDFYDYGLVMAAAGRMQSGEHPYVDFVTPIQTLHFLQATWAEAVFGPRYLSLTYANALFMLAAFAGGLGLLWRPLGGRVAVLVSAAVVTASAGQHTIVWHNAMGVIWVAAVVWLTARRRPDGEPGTWLRLTAVCLVLWLGGMTKLTYQATALAFALLFALRDGWMGGHSWRRTGLTLLSYAAFGTIVPLATELWVTGASLAEWWHNVIVTPGSRFELLAQMANLRFYLHTPHDYYPPLYFPFVGAWGVGLLILLAVGALKSRERSARTLLLVAAAGGGAWICGGVLLATNFDIAYLAGASWLALATGLALATLADGDGRVRAWVRLTLGVAACSLLLPAWQAAWNGTRAIWGHYFDGRDAMVSTDDLSPRYAYFHGMKVTRVLHESMQSFDRRWQEIEQAGKAGEGSYFINGTEWMIRAFPGARIRGLPLWLHDGTTYGESSAYAINEQLARSTAIAAVVSFGGWDVYRYGMQWYLDARFDLERTGPALRVYSLRDDARVLWTDPLAFSTYTESTADARDLTETGGPFVMHRTSDSQYLATPRSGRILIGAPLDGLRGEIVVRRTPVAGDSTIRMIWRAVALGDQGDETILHEEALDIRKEEAERTVAFAFAPPGQRVALDIFLPPDERLEAGVRRLETDYSATNETAYPPWLNPLLKEQPEAERWPAALFSDNPLPSGGPIRGAGLAVSAVQIAGEPELFAHAPSEVWFWLEPGFQRLRGEFGLRPAAWTEEHALPGVMARVIAYRPGYIQILEEKTLRPKLIEADRTPQSFDVALPRQGAWIGLTFEPLVPDRTAHGHSWWRKFEAR